MNSPRSIRQQRKPSFLLLAILATYACGRVLEVFAGSVPHLWIVALDVISAAVFAFVDGSRRFGWRGILVFATICLAVGSCVEEIGVATGFPFGHYRFLKLMGPKIGEVPVLLGLAYVGMAYVSWMLARLILDIDKPDAAPRPLWALPALASLVMTMWDVAQDPVWSTILHGWTWYDGGAWFGVPISNFLGWYANLFLIYSLFAIYSRRVSPAAATLNAAPRWPAPAFYAVCAAGNVLQLASSSAPATIMDATGKSWQSSHIVAASALVSIAGMGFFVVLSCRTSGLPTQMRSENMSLREQG